MHVTKNYTDQRGNRTVIGGELKIEAGAVISGDGAANLAAVATATVLGGVKAAAAGAGDTVECKINGTSKRLMVPAYPGSATEEAEGLVKVAENVATPAADASTADVRTALIATLTALKAAGIMAADSEGAT